MLDYFFLSFYFILFLWKRVAEVKKCVFLCEDGLRIVIYVFVIFSVNGHFFKFILLYFRGKKNVLEF